MLKGIKPGELVKKAGGAKGAELAKNGAKKAANHKAVDKAFQKGIDKTAEKAIGAGFAFASPLVARLPRSSASATSARSAATPPT